MYFPDETLATTSHPPDAVLERQSVLQVLQVERPQRRTEERGSREKSSCFPSLYLRHFERVRDCSGPHSTPLPGRAVRTLAAPIVARTSNTQAVTRLEGQAEARSPRTFPFTQKCQVEPQASQCACVAISFLDNPVARRERPPVMIAPVAFPPLIPFLTLTVLA